MDDQKIKLPFLERHPKLYKVFFDFWLWYQKKIMHIPFRLDYNKDFPEGRRLMAVTFSWDLEYIQAIKNNWDLQERYNKNELQLKRAEQLVGELQDHIKKLEGKSDRKNGS